MRMRLVYSLAYYGLVASGGYFCGFDAIANPIFGEYRTPELNVDDLKQITAYYFGGLFIATFPPERMMDKVISSVVYSGAYFAGVAAATSYKSDLFASNSDSAAIGNSSNFTSIKPDF